MTKLNFHFFTSFRRNVNVEPVSNADRPLDFDRHDAPASPTSFHGADVPTRAAVLEARSHFAALENHHPSELAASVRSSGTGMLWSALASVAPSVCSGLRRSVR